ncbi:MAG: hypothetical protein Kow0074_07740 [Candidatus Zixiibacteriota bacterium]
MTTTQTPPRVQRMTRQRVAELRVQCQQHPDDIELQRRTAADFAAAGLAGEAIPILRRLASLCPDDESVTRQLADLLTVQEHYADAMDLYRKLAEAAPESVDAQHNYGVAACHAERYDQAIIAFEKKLALDPENYETLNDLAVLYAMTERYNDAARMYKRCLTVNPRYDRAQDNAFQFFLETGRVDEGVALADQISGVVGRDRRVEEWKRRLAASGTSVQSPGNDSVDISCGSSRVTGKRIGFVASSDSFLRPIVQHFRQANEVRTFTGTSLRELAELLQWADLVWYEWCDQLVIEGSKLPRRAKTVCRLHSYETFTDMPRQVNWSNIDHLILVSETVGEILDEMSVITSPRTVIHNGIDPQQFPLGERGALGKKIASVGYINYKKNPSLLLQTFKAIHDWDPEFEFHIAGRHQDPRIQVYMDNLLPRLNLPVTVHGWVSDMPAFYTRMDFVISTSLFESFHYSIAEGMLSGCVPLIHTWRGSDRLYPNQFLFNTPDEAVDLIKRCQSMDIDELRRDNRNFITQRYTWTDKLEEIDRLLDGVIRGEQQNVRERVHVWERPEQTDDIPDCGTVSVVIPVHNQSTSVGITIDSVLAQTYPDIEVIVADDGSADDLDTALRRYDGRVHVVRQVKRGCAAALNTAIQSSKGSFVAIALPGDSFAPQKLESQLRQFAHTPDLGMATCDVLDHGGSAPTPADIAAAVDRCLGKPHDFSDTVSPSSIVVRRDALCEIGWFEEYAPYADNPHALAQSLVRRAARVSSVRRVSEVLVAPSRQATAPEPVVQASVERWTSFVCARERTGDAAPAPGPSSSPAATAGLNITFVGAHDPRGQMMMWAEALTQHTPHTVRVLAHTERTGCPSDLVINRRGPGRLTGKKAPSAMTVISDAERIVAESDLIIFAAGIAPGCSRDDARLTDTDEQAFGTLEWASHLKGKRCAALLFGTPSVRGNLQWYRDHIGNKGWPILTCDPDIHRWLADSMFLPRLLSRTGTRFGVAHHQADQIVVLHPGGRPPHEGGGMFREAAQRAKSKHANLTFGLYDGLSWADMLVMKRQAHIGFDRIAVGSGHFGIDSLENSAMGLVNIAYCDPYTRALIAESLGTSELPWRQPASTDELERILTMYAEDSDQLHQDMETTRQWYSRHWDERRLAPHIAEQLESLM